MTYIYILWNFIISIVIQFMHTFHTVYGVKYNVQWQTNPRMKQKWTQKILSVLAWIHGGLQNESILQRKYQWIKKNCLLQSNYQYQTSAFAERRELSS